MGKPFFNRLFGRSQEPAGETTETKAGHGDADAQFILGINFAGEGAAQDYGQAASWYLKAADQGHTLAQFNLAIMYAMGQGMPRDEIQSMRWMQKAADLGDAGAQFRVGMKHHRASLGSSGKIAHELRIESYMWLQLSMAQGYRGSEQACENIALLMTRDDVANGARRVAAFVPGAGRS
jgi:TPR repeat protein